MAAASGLFGLSIEKCFDNSAALDWDGDTQKGQLHTDTFSPSFDVHDFIADLANEVTGTGYTTGGETLTTVASTVGSPATGQIKLDFDDLQWTSATISSIEAMAVVDTTVASSPLWGYTDFGATYGVTAGTLDVQIDANGWAYLDYVP